MAGDVRLSPSALDALDKFKVGVVRLDGQQVVASASGFTTSLIMPDELVGRHISELFPDTETWAKIQSEIRSRMQGLASAYETVITRSCDGARIPVSVLGVPEVDETGQVVGSLAFIRDLREERADRAMHLAIETKRTGREILAEVAGELARLVPFDAFRVTAVSRSRTHLRQLYATDADASFSRFYRWWPMPKFALEMVNDEHPKRFALEGFFKQPGWAEVARDDEATREYLAQGFKHVLSLPVIEGKSVVAFIGIDSKRAETPFTQETIDLCVRLPLAEAVLMAMHYEEEDRLGFSVELIRELGKVSDDIQKVSQSLVDRLACQFDWDHVAIFQRDEDSGGFRVLSEGGNGKARLPDGFILRPEEGIVGAAFLSPNKRINEPNVAANRSYHVGVPDIRSELCLVVPGAVERWALNVESKQLNAFAEEEIEAVDMLVREAGIILERAALLHLRTAILDSINDAVIETDRRGVIRDANKAAGRLVGREPAKLKDTSLKQILADKDLAEAAVQADFFACEETNVLMLDGEQVPVLLSGSELPKQLGGRVFVASDLTYQKKVQRIGMLKEVFKQAALESRVPLAIAGNWIAQLGRDNDVPVDSVERILKQLRKVDLPLERLMRIAGGGASPVAARVTASLPRVVESILDELPADERGQIKFQNLSADAVVSGSDDTLRFCIETMLSFALRTRPQDRRVNMTLRADDSRAHLSVQGDWTPDFKSAGDPDVSDRWRRQAIADFALGEDILRRLAKDGGGEFDCELEGRMVLALRMPVVVQAGVSHA
jgi:PAS domain S-box-containing protein